jgi:hypothetical protein
VFVCVQRGREINVRGLGASHLNDADDTGRDETSLSAKGTERRRKRELAVLVALPGGRDVGRKHARKGADEWSVIAWGSSLGCSSWPGPDE